jgi:hypothetical protein
MTNYNGVATAINTLMQPLLRTLSSDVAQHIDCVHSLNTKFDCLSKMGLPAHIVAPWTSIPPLPPIKQPNPTYIPPINLHCNRDFSSAWPENDTYHQHVSNNTGFEN